MLRRPVEPTCIKAIGSTLVDHAHEVFFLHDACERTARWLGAERAVEVTFLANLEIHGARKTNGRTSRVRRDFEVFLAVHRYMVLQPVYVLSAKPFH